MAMFRLTSATVDVMRRQVPDMDQDRLVHMRGEKA
jgi:hypothetical protein